MEIIHHVAYRDSWNHSLRQELESENIKYQFAKDADQKDGIVAFDISESHSFWKRMLKLEKGLLGWFVYGDMEDTYFSKDEILNSEWARIIVENVKKYPQPFATWSRDPVNYEKFCGNCGTHDQVRPFRIQAETKWGYFHFFTFFWGHAVFARKEVFDAVRRKKLRGATRMELLINRTGEPTKDIFQLLPAYITRGGFLAEKKIKTTRCKKCSSRKYSYHSRGVMRYKRDPIMNDADILYTREWFGVGGRDAWREILISNRFARMILQEGWKGVRLKAVEIV